MSEIFTWLTNELGYVNVTMFAISFFSTVPERLLLFVLCLVVLTGAFVGVRFVGSMALRYFIPAAISFALFASLYLIFPFTEYPFPVTGYLFPGDRPFAVAAVLTAMVTATVWWARRRGPRETGMANGLATAKWLPIAVVVSGVAVALLNGWSMRGLARTLHADPAVSQVAFGDFNWMELDTDKGVLFASGHGTNNLLAFDVKAFNRAARKSEVEIGWAQAFALNRTNSELYVFNVETRSLLLLDAEGLSLKREIPIPEIAPADSFLAWDKRTGHILVASETDEDGYPTVVIDRNAGEVLYYMDWNAPNVFGDPESSRVYLPVDGEPNLIAYDLETRQVAAATTTPNIYVDRLTGASAQNEILVAAPLESVVVRFDYDTLEWKGSIPTVLGVRSLAVDSDRNLLLAGSLLSNMVEVIDLATHSQVAKYYVGPWLRTITIDAPAGVAYVSSIEGIFRIDYGAGYKLASLSGL